MTAYYNEIDPYAAQWLRNLISAGHIAPGDVDERSISDVRPDDLRGYTQCHFFAGIGVWSLALRRAGWPDERPVWTGSCPCQPFSAAGAGEGFADERHLWPHWHHLIRLHRPTNLFGEQVASKDGLGWLDLVQSDLEGTGYACWPVDLCAAGVGAPHIRQRLWFTGVLADTARVNQWAGLRDPRSTGLGRNLTANCAAVGQLEHGFGARLEGYSRDVLDRDKPRWIGADTGRPVATTGAVGGMGHNGAPNEPGPTNSLWADADWLFCRDGKWRPVEPGTFPLAHGATSRVGRLRAYGNAIVVQAAQTIIEVYLEHERAGAVALVGHGGGLTNMLG